MIVSKKTSLLISTIFLAFVVKSQDIDTVKTNQISNVIIKKEAGIDNIIKTHQSSFKQEGYRIQIYSGNKRQPAREVKSKYVSLHLKAKAHELYQQPYFKIRVGDFKTKLEAIKFEKELNTHFPNCFIVKDEIDIETLIE